MLHKDRSVRPTMREVRSALVSLQAQLPEPTISVGAEPASAMIAPRPGLVLASPLRRWATRWGSHCRASESRSAGCWLQGHPGWRHDTARAGSGVLSQRLDRRRHRRLRVHQPIQAPGTVQLASPRRLSLRFHGPPNHRRDVCRPLSRRLPISRLNESRRRPHRSSRALHPRPSQI